MYEQFGIPGLVAFDKTVKYAKEKDLVVIGDVKRGDIGSTSAAYATGHLGKVKVGNNTYSLFDEDFATVNPYLGTDGIKPFVDVCKEEKKGLFILVKTSNPSSGEFQDRMIDGRPLYEWVGEQVAKWGEDIMGDDYSYVGAVVGATYPEMGKVLRKVMPKSYILVPGYGAQGGTADGLKPYFNEDGLGAIVNSSRGIDVYKRQVAKLPALKGKCDTVTIMSYGFDPYLSSWSPYHGAIYAVVDSVAKVVATGGDYKKIRFTFQEYFRRMTEDPKRWSQPFAALLGAYDAQMGFGLPSIGGKDSMSGTFNDIDVPPTLVSFAVDVAKEKDIITPEFKEVGSKIVKFEICRDQYEKPNYECMMKLYDAIHEMIQNGTIISAYALDSKGVIPAVSKMAFGNKIGVCLLYTSRCV